MKFSWLVTCYSSSEIKNGDLIVFSFFISDIFSSSERFVTTVIDGVNTCWRKKVCQVSLPLCVFCSAGTAKVDG